MMRCIVPDPCCLPGRVSVSDDEIGEPTKRGPTRSRRSAGPWRRTALRTRRYHREPVVTTSPETSDRPGARLADLVRTISTAGGVAARAIIGSNLIAEAMMLRPLAPTAANALGRVLMGTVLIAVGAGRTGSDEEGESVQVQLRGNGPLGSIVAISDERGRVRGTVSEPDTNLVLADGTPDVARSIGLGTLTVVRHRPGWREPYSGTVPLVSGEVAKDITLYLSESEQTPSAMGLGVAMANDESAVVAAGFLVQILPGALQSEIARVESNILALPRLSDLVLTGTDSHDLIDRLLDGLGSRTRHGMKPVFYCPCTRERALRTLQLLDRSELDEMRSAGESQEVRCHFCARAYVFGPDAIESVIATA
jgi:molecular chaperone Hsp33